MTATLVDASGILVVYPGPSPIIANHGHAAASSGRPPVIHHLLRPDDDNRTTREIAERVGVVRITANNSPNYLYRAAVVLVSGLVGYSLASVLGPLLL